KAEKSLVPRLWLEAESIVLQCRRVEMFQPAAAAQVYDECIVVIRQLAKDLVRLFDDLGDIGRRFLHVVVAVAAKNYSVRFALNCKANLFKITHLKRR